MKSVNENMNGNTEERKHDDMKLIHTLQDKSEELEDKIATLKKRNSQLLKRLDGEAKEKIKLDYEIKHIKSEIMRKQKVLVKEPETIKVLKERVSE